ncbi:bifunctional riboflavin kinase/FAD synthetase [Desulfovibrionales bacterium]
MTCISVPEHIPGLEHGSCVTIGNFDGVHQGHRHLLLRVRDRAKHLGLPSVVITFDPHPQRFFTGSKTPPLITVHDEKIALISELGVDFVVCLEFNDAMARMSPHEFVRRILVQDMHVRELIIGYDYAFGKGRQGNYALLCTLAQELGFSVEQMDPVLVDGDIVSSTRIRDLVEAGDVWAARPLLGRFYRVTGTVVHGQDRGGRLLGFPTANMHLRDELFPRTGVYCCWAEIDDQIHPAVANIGFNPTFGNDVLSVEVHVLDFQANLYDKTIRVHFVHRLRGEKKFTGIEELQAQIARDIKQGRDILAQPEAQPYQSSPLT